MADRVSENDTALIVDPSRGSRAPNLEFAQGVYYLLTGAWPLVSPGTFQMVTGPKHEMWLTKTVGALAGVMGAVLTYAGIRRRRPSELVLLGMGAAGAFAAIDIVYASKRRISRIYLVDAAVELGLLGLWIFARGRLPYRRQPVERP
jgi:hypothetical protein